MLFQNPATPYQKVESFFSPWTWWTCDCSEHQRRKEMMFCNSQGYVIERIQLLPGSLFLECMLWGTQIVHLKKAKLIHLERSQAETHMERNWSLPSQKPATTARMNESSDDSSSQPLKFSSFRHCGTKREAILLCPVQTPDPQNLWA